MKEGAEDKQTGRLVEGCWAGIIQKMVLEPFWKLPRHFRPKTINILITLRQFIKINRPHEELPRATVLVWDTFAYTKTQE